jgi:hypothetical protein
LMIVVMSMTRIPNLEFGWLSLHLLIGLMRSLLIAYLFWQSIRLAREI